MTKKSKQEVVPQGFKASRRGFLKGTAVVLVGASTLTGVQLGGIRKAKAAEGDAYPGVFPDQDASEVRWGFLIDLTRCTGCHACAIACKTEHDVRLGVFRNGVRYHESGTYPAVERDFAPWLCNQCKNAPCMARCPTDPIKGALEFPSGESTEYWAKATYQRPDGLVLVDEDRCVGCGRCVEDCPYKARYLNTGQPAGADPAEVGLDIENPKAAGKCDFCVHRLEKGVVPACVNTCPPEARLMGNLNDPDSEISKRIAEAGDAVSVLWEGVGTEPTVFYIDLVQDAYTKGSETKLEAGMQELTPGV
ncbi:MAG: 4Fe-4S dicluster domain-containing protein [Lentisphaerae bacterium]|nr:4Fe-4S dicluster domain-containing protein [Lentisphaerota bacterium]